MIHSFFIGIDSYSQYFCYAPRQPHSAPSRQLVRSLAANGDSPPTRGTTSRESAQHLDFLFQDTVNGHLASAATTLAHDIVSGVKTFELDADRIQEASFEDTACRLAADFHGDSKHQSFITEQRQIMGKPTTMVAFPNGTKFDTRTLGSSFEKHRAQNNRLSAGAAASNAPGDDKRKRPAVSQLRKINASVNSLPPAAYDIGPGSMAPSQSAARSNSSAASSTPASLSTGTSNLTASSSFSFGEASSFESLVGGGGGVAYSRHDEQTPRARSGGYFASVPTTRTTYGGFVDLQASPQEEQDFARVQAMREELLGLSLRQARAGVANAADPVALAAKRRTHHILADESLADTYVAAALIDDPGKSVQSVAEYYDFIM